MKRRNDSYQKLYIQRKSRASGIIHFTGPDKRPGIRCRNAFLSALSNIEFIREGRVQNMEIDIELAIVLLYANTHLYSRSLAAMVCFNL